MNILNIIDTIYESKYFPTMLIISIVILVFLFVAVILLGLRDSKKSKEPNKEIFQDIKDITFEPPSEKEAIKEDVTFEIPVLTKNLENFKKSLEEEIEREEKVNVIKKTSEPLEDVKPSKILDKNKIDNTAVMPIINIDSLQVHSQEDILEEEPRFQKREILKELFKNRKPQEVEPPKVKGDQLEDQNIKEEKEEILKTEFVLKKEQPFKADQLSQKEEVYNKGEIQKTAKTVTINKKETKYSGDDDF